MKPINDLIWNPEDEIAPASEQMAPECHGGPDKCMTLSNIIAEYPDVPLFNIDCQ